MATNPEGTCAKTLDGGLNPRLAQTDIGTRDATLSVVYTVYFQDETITEAFQT
jgi:hypothetical protein